MLNLKPSSQAKIANQDGQLSTQDALIERKEGRIKRLEKIARGLQTIQQVLYALWADCCAIACRVIDETKALVLDSGQGKTKTD